MADGTIPAPAKSGGKTLETIQLTKTQRIALTHVLGMVADGISAEIDADHKPWCAGCECDLEEIVEITDMFERKLGASEMFALRDLARELGKLRTV